MGVRRKILRLKHNILHTPDNPINFINDDCKSVIIWQCTGTAERNKKEFSAPVLIRLSEASYRKMVGVIFENTKLVALGSAAAISGLILGALWYRKYLKNRPPTEWVKVGEVEKLCIYPVKSFKEVQTSSFECTPLGARLGFMMDRSFLVVNEEGKLVTGRDYPKMTQLLPKVSHTVITFSCPDSPDVIELDMEKIEGERKRVMIWDAWAEGMDCGEEMAFWLSKCILGRDSGLRLLFCGLEEKGKAINPRITSYSKIVNVELQKSDGGFFSDGVSYHMISQASVKELNTRLNDVQISAMNFRPNFIIKGDTLIPYEEDNWKWVKIGNVVFRCIAPCTRCLFTTVDPNTGEKYRKMEPLASLRRYRFLRDPEKKKLLTTPAMGIYLGVRSAGTVSVGDEVFVS